MLKIYGYSDDNVEIESDDNNVADEIGCYDQDVRLVIGYPEAAPGRDSQGLVVTMRYAPKGYGPVWVACVSQIDEDIQIPWPVSITSEKYTAIVKVECPIGTPVAVKKVKGE